MVDTERKNPLRVLRNRTERRIKSSEELARSQPVVLFRDILSKNRQEGVVTTTDPKINPFGRVNVEVSWRIVPDGLGVVTEQDGQETLPTYSGNKATFTWANSGREKHTGIMVYSGTGEEYIDNQAPVKDQLALLRAVAEKPSRFNQWYRPGTEPGRKLIK